MISKKFCPITGKLWTETTIIDGSDKEGEIKVTGYKICPQSQEIINKGFIAFVGAIEAESLKDDSGNFIPNQVKRVGGIAYVPKVLVEKEFKDPITSEYVFCDPQMVAHLTTIGTESEKTVHKIITNL